MSDIICYIKEFEGIIGAILGSVATLIVTNWLRKKGGLKIYILNSKSEFSYEDNGDIISWRNSKKNKLLEYKYSIELNIYNSSDICRNIKNLRFKIFNDNKQLLEGEWKDKNQKKIRNEIVSYDYLKNIKVCNIYPMVVNEFNLYFCLSTEEYRKIDNNKKVKLVLCYYDDKDKYRELILFNDYLKEPEPQNQS